MKRFLLILVLFILLLSLLSSNSEKSTVAERISKLIEYSYKNDMFNGAVLVARNGKVIYKNALGMANFEQKKKLKLNSNICIGSVSKQFTAMAIMILKERGKLKYENKLSTYFPDFPNADKITIRQLLNHTAGIPRYSNQSRFRVPGRPGDFIDNITNRDIYDFLIENGKLDFTPGERYAYTNSGYSLLAIVVEKISQKPFYLFMNQNIFAPLKMNDTLVWNKTKPLLPEKATGYNEFGDKDDYNVLTSGAGSIYSTVEDLLKWDQALYTEKLVSRRTLEEAFTPGRLNDGSLCKSRPDSTYSYGFGWLVFKNESENIVYHDGGFNGFSAVLYRELNNRDFIVLLSNKGTNGPLYPIYDRIKKILKGESIDYHRIPISVTVKNLIDRYGVATAIRKFRELKKSSADKFVFSVNQLNALGYRYINKGKLKIARSVFKLNVELYPQDGNTYDSYAEACMRLGEDEEAIKNYKKSLELNPKNHNAMKMLERISKKK